MANHPLIWLALFCASLLSSFFATSAAAGLRLELTHVDAKDNCTVEERLLRATERTTHRRLASMGGSSVGVAAPVRWSETQYVAEYLIGDPPQRAEAIVDTGSDLVWTQCSACRATAGGCFAQNLPYYDPSRSRTGAQPAACGDAVCALGSAITRCASRAGGEACAVAVRYGAGDVVGFLRTETFAFGSEEEEEEEEVSLAFGCVVATALSPGSLDGASGIIGLGRGALSLVSQLGDTRFSYCLTPYLRDDAAKPSHLFVGAYADLSGGGAPVTSVPFARNPNEYPFSTFYYLPLVGLSVGTARLAIAAAAFELRRIAAGVWAGGTFIDSGSPFTTLVDAAYQALRADLVRQLGASLVRPRTGGLDLCVARGVAGRVVPPLVLHFGSGGGDVVVPPENYWGPVDGATECMLVFNSAARTDSTLPLNETTIIGSYMQQDVHLLYDLGNGVLSFQTADCSSM